MWDGRHAPGKKGISPVLTVFTKLAVVCRQPSCCCDGLSCSFSGDLDEKVKCASIFSSVWRYGYTLRAFNPQHRIALNPLADCCIAHLHRTLANGGGRALPRRGVTGLSSENEDTWDSLISTQLTGWEILRGKSNRSNLGSSRIRRKPARPILAGRAVRPVRSIRSGWCSPWSWSSITAPGSWQRWELMPRP